MVNLLTTTRILTALEKVPASQREELNLPVKLEANGPIAHDQLIRLSRYLQNNPESESNDADQAAPPSVLNSLLRGTKAYVPPPPPKPEPTPEYLASKAILQARADQLAYNRLLNPTTTQTPEHYDPYHSSDPSNPNSVDYQDTLTPSLVINIFLSVVITGFSVYWALTKFATPDILYEGFAAWTAGENSGKRKSAGGGGDRQGISEAVRVLIAFFAALAVAVAEAFLYAAYSDKVERARVKERGLRERKVFVGRVGENESQEVKGDGEPVIVGDEKEEIWGKGVNGGVRRRVREKWEKEKDGVVE
ncbi:uncharacterized protein N7511_010558 [Penicillium nucicola]|uniref:uncharacterized protein n=1 Tax=Penicillium nucicola TaxID=1850975 RepID=UPI0025456E32|nr:uncharacterized protein N7511_010558 [Penicillium nucicola]KAJ5748862.1 hypothetical protein N7511_010558 [Penicillium nucicola]